MTPWRGGGAETAARATTSGTDDLEGTRGAVEPDRDRVSHRGISADRWAPVDAAASDSRRCPLRLAHGLSVEGGPTGIWNGFHVAPAIPAVGRAGHLGSDLAPAPTALRSSRRARVAVAVRRCVAAQSPAGRGKKPAPIRPTAPRAAPSVITSPTVRSSVSPDTNAPPENASPEPPPKRGCAPGPVPGKLKEAVTPAT